MEKNTQEHRLGLNITCKDSSSSGIYNSAFLSLPPTVCECNVKVIRLEVDIVIQLQ